jgi:hypothetical protein
VLTTLALLACTAWSAAQQTRPTTAPAMDASTPRAALRTLNIAMRDGDVATITHLFLAATPSEEKMVKADAQMAGALADLRRAAVAAFGADGARIVTGDTAAGSAESLARIEAADITATGDTATVSYRDEKQSPFVLKKVGNEWKVPVSELGKPLEKSALDQRLADLAIQTAVVRQIVARIEQHKFVRAEEAREAWQTRILQAATSQPATTQPVKRD